MKTKEIIKEKIVIKNTGNIKKNLKINVLKEMKISIEETKDEIRKITWPTRNKVISTTVIIVAIMLASAIFIGVFDILVSKTIFYISEVIKL